MSLPQANARNLRRIMHQQHKTGGALLALATESERSIIDGDTRKLAEIEGRQRALVDQSAAQETGRQEATADLAAKLGMDPDATLSMLVPVLSSTDVIALTTLRAQIVAVQSRTETQNRCNARLLENALGFVKFNLEALTTAALRPARYGVNLARLEAPSFYVDSKA